MTSSPLRKLERERRRSAEKVIHHRALRAERKYGPRFTASGLIRGCPTTVTADTAEEAERMLEAMDA